MQAARQASKKALHTTLIRNEAAYFSCIAQLLEEHPPPPIKAQLKPLYLCGDSHTLSGQLLLARSNDGNKFQSNDGNNLSGISRYALSSSSDH